PLVFEDPSHPALLCLDHVTVETAPGLALVPRLRGELALQDWRHERVRVDLAVRMAERDPDLLAAILEDVHVLDVWKAAQLIGAVAPDLDQVEDVVDALLPERGVVVRRIAHDLGAPLVA